MDSYHRRLLRSNRVRLVKDMFPDRVVSKMRGGLLNEADCEAIVSRTTAKAQAEELLTILPRKGPKAFGEFVKALRDVQSHLAEPFLAAAGLSESNDEASREGAGRVNPTDLVTMLPSDVESRLHALLDAENVLGDNWERVYAEVGLPLDRLPKVKESTSPTGTTLRLWHGRQASRANVHTLVEILRRIPRLDVVEMLQDAMTKTPKSNVLN